MAHDVFVCYAKHDKHVADAACARLEANRVRCWIAPRDVPPGQEYPSAIVEAISSSGALILIFSGNSNNSPHVLREVELAVTRGLPIIPFKIDNVEPGLTMEYFVSTRHWLDAMTPPLDRHLERLVESVRLILPLQDAYTDSAPQIIESEKHHSKSEGWWGPGSRSSVPAAYSRSDLVQTESWWNGTRRTIGRLGAGMGHGA